MRTKSEVRAAANASSWVTRTCAATPKPRQSKSTAAIHWPREGRRVSAARTAAHPVGRDASG